MATRSRQAAGEMSEVPAARRMVLEPVLEPSYHGMIARSLAGALLCKYDYSGEGEIRCDCPRR
jgi:hypothetical protein